MRLPESRSRTTASLRLGALCAAISMGLWLHLDGADTRVAQPLDAQQIAERLVGRDIVVTHARGQASARLEETGVMRAEGPNWSATGHWMVFDDSLCFYMLGGPVNRNACQVIHAIGPDEFLTERGTRLTVLEPTDMDPHHG